MKLTFLGATHEVTGSCFYLQACGKNILIDCGMEQGADIFENQEIPVGANELDYVFLTHAHIDHTGKVPMLYKNGFSGQIHATDATCDLCNIMLKDAAHIQEFEAEWRNRKARRSGKDEYVPLYTMNDALGAISLLIPHRYSSKFKLCEGIEARFTDVGHLLGSASIEFWLTEEGVTKKVVFSGDIGNLHQPIIKDPHYIEEADFITMECTYGNRSHGPRPDYVNSLAEIIQQTFDRGGNVVIPSFAVGRTQEMLYFIREIKSRGLIKGHPNFPVYVDSPLAVEATGIFNENYLENFDEEAMALINKGVNPLSFEGLSLTVTSEESKAINFDNKSKVIISASGMCEAGRIRHHLKHNLWRKDSTILFVGYQAVGTLGRALVEGAQSVKLFGETIEVVADIRQLPGVSGHADRDGLLAWVKAFKNPQKVFVVHGEDTVCTQFAEDLTAMGIRAGAPFSGSCFDLLADEWVSKNDGVKIEKTQSYAQKRASSTFERLVAAGKRLLGVIENNRHSSNKELARFADQVTSLCDKWDV